MTPLEIIEENAKQTGSTWYNPKPSEISEFRKYKDEGIIEEVNGLYSTPYIKELEKNIAKYAVARLHYGEINKTVYPNLFINLCIELYEEMEKIKLDEWQKIAVHTALENNLFVLTGGPGTGKTCVLKCIHYCLRHILKTEDIIFAAPTGKAARRITESVGVSASTVAKTLGLHGEENEEAKEIHNKVVIVDEISMLDTYTAEKLFKAVSLNTKLILVGDVEQLPSVGYGSVLRDLIDAGIPCVKLEKTFRQASESGIFANIEQIKAGLNMGFIERDDFKVFYPESIEEAQKIMVAEYLKAIKQYGKDQVVCLTPYRRKGLGCAIVINKILQDIINPSVGKPTITVNIKEDDDFQYDLKLVEGDPVMQLVNVAKVANGDVGWVKLIDMKQETLTVKFTDCEVVYKFDELSQLCLAYAMSVHKSQGSEYACVITSATESDLDMLSKNTIYTAVTRAKKECRVITNKNIPEMACKIEAGYERRTLLNHFIQKEKKKYEMISNYYKEGKK